jgi:acetylornithine/succinyldiaminopimelate/putrescine aminotransferase/acyl-CoA synthetase (AMP-forming)/AMP-acid ligase II/predicted amino acid dehydrogenase/acyl carrier protein
MNGVFDSMVEVLRLRAAEQGADRAYTFLQDGAEADRLTFAELDQRARAIGAELQRAGCAGERVLLLYPPGLDYVAAFYGCLYAGAVAVPAYPPRANGNLNRLQAIFEDARPKAVLTTTALLAQLRGRRGAAAELAASRWLTAADLDGGGAAGWRDPQARPDTLAFLQYTSGSTARPKGVMVSHGNLLHNEQVMRQMIVDLEHKVFVSWLPIYHDMGLIGNVLCSLYNGAPCYLMAPVDFLKRPATWLEAITRYRGTCGGGPDFAYRICCEKIGPAETATLDLASWRVAFNGSEPIRAATIESFAAAFAACGFRRAAFLTCYGLAEATLYVTGHLGDGAVATFARTALAERSAVPAPAEGTDTVPLVSSGLPGSDTRVAIVDPDTCSPCAEGRLGEIWVSGGSVAKGYWGRAEETAAVFDARCQPDGDGPFLRTGDLGFLHQGELYVKGRLKELIILRGRNHYPHDLEDTVERSHPAVSPGFCAAFSVEAAGCEQLAVVAEVRREQRRSADLEAVIQAVREAIALEHGVAASAVVLLRPGGLPKTTSGKTQRGRTRDALLAGEIQPLAGWWVPDLRELLRTAPRRRPVATAAEIEDWLAAKLAAKLKIDSGRLDRRRDGAIHGLDSLAVVELASEVEEGLGVSLPADLLLTGQPSVARLAEMLHQQVVLLTDNLPATRVALSRVSRSTHPAPPMAAAAAVAAAAPVPAPTGGSRTAGGANGGPPGAESASAAFRRAVNPELGRVLQQMKMDKTFVRGEGCYLFDGAGRRYLDFLAQYGALPFGFNPPAIWSALAAVRERAEPSFAQPSAPAAAGELARRLLAAAPPGLSYVTFANSGAEAVEAAIKLCRSTTGRPHLLAAHNGFHGKTLGALSATDKKRYQEPFGAPVAGFSYVPYGDAEALRRRLAERDCAGFLVEPLQGEGGIVEPPTGYLRAAQEICREAGTLLVVDEIQTGLGRVGTMFACAQDGVTPDVMTLAKALGGGLLPIGACLATAAAYNHEFALKHTSTFAGNALACRAALATLDLLQADEGALVRQVAANGARLKAELEELRRRYPQLLGPVRGRGYMLGLHFSLDRHTAGGGLLGCLAEQEILTALVVSHLLNREQVRVGYTLNHGGVLRVEPPLVAGWQECQLFLDAFERVLSRLERRDIADLTAHLTGYEAGIAAARRPSPRPAARPAGGQGRPAPRPLYRARGASRREQPGRFAFLVHPLEIRDYADFDAGLSPLADAQLERLSACLADNFDPFVVGDTVIVSDAGRSAQGEFVVVPRTAAELRRMPPTAAVAEIARAAEIAGQRGAEIVGLGAYLSIATHAGLALKGRALPALTTGNSYTVVAATQALRAGLALARGGLGGAAVAVLGAAGSIGRAISTLLAQEAARLVLLGNPEHPAGAGARLIEAAADVIAATWRRRDAGEDGGGPLAVQILDLLPASPCPAEPARLLAQARELLRRSPALVTSTAASEWLPRVDVVITATSSTAALIQPESLAAGAVVCDISRPSNVDPRVHEMRPDVLVIDGGVVRMPGRSVLGFNSGLGQGLAYACMAETMILALEHRYQDASLGLRLDHQLLAELATLAAKHGFMPAVAAVPNAPEALRVMHLLGQEGNEAQVLEGAPSPSLLQSAGKGTLTP